MNDSESVFLLLLVIALAIFLMPALVAFLRRHPNRWIILLFNVFLGATGIVWFGCLIWAFRAIHIAATLNRSNGGESGLNLTANDVVRVRFEERAQQPPPLTPPLRADDVFVRLERLKKLHDDGVIDADQFAKMRDGIVQAG
ncbi:superinfection immunity protein [Mesorhizobium sp. BR1-1-2]|uniref:superinfection immunity protein n=1 Tax=Mesorhizobium sp. BR1-1-2 TaxID=2876652 RepID=UPI001CCFDFB3|nr:superinfection immunity protein [Mesorhizobium sp. BR1-1-2]MBZ9964999.1 superinfection immunity protein [Mesorhizobium sp. BR1-1-2]